MFLLVIDGRQLSSVGATEAETALILKKLGAQNALNMDGGGSSTFVLCKDGVPIVINKPVHKFVSGRERAVATCIGLTR
jgi:exopolysaccharide biosynthesis protein